MQQIGNGDLGSYAVIELNFEDGFVTDTNVIDGGINWVDGSFYVLLDPETNYESSVTLNFTGDDVLDNGLWLYYENNQDLEEIYGKWYDGNVVNNNSNLQICPAGWRVPNISDISELGGYLGVQDGSLMQWSQVTGSLVPEGETGFDAYGNGYVVFIREEFRQDGDFGEWANFWFKGTAPDGGPYGWFHFRTPPNSNQSLTTSGGNNASIGYCIRCIKD